VARPNIHRVLDCFGQVISGIDQLQRQLSAIHTGVTGAANRLEGSGRTSEVLGPVSPVPSRPQGTSLLGELPEGRWSCDRLLSRILKPGQTVTIHWPGGEQTYRGKEAQT
jgi:hypothetical protein